MAVRGIDSLCSPLRGSPFAVRPVCPTGCASCRTPVGGSHPPWFGDTYKQKARTSVQALNLNMAVRGIDSLRSPFGQSLASSSSVQLAAPVVEPRSVVLIPLGLGIHISKARTSVQALNLNMAVRGIDSLRSPFGQSPRKLVVCPTGCASCRTPVGGSHPPWFGDTYKQNRTSVQALNLNMAVRGIDSLRSPFGQPVRCAPGLSNWLRQLSNPVGGSHPLSLGIHISKARTSVQALNLNMAVRGFEPRYVAVYTLSGRAPSATRTPHHIVLLPDRLGATGRYYRELR